MAHENQRAEDVLSVPEIDVITLCAWCAHVHPNKTMSRSIKDHTHFLIYYFSTKFSHASLWDPSYVVVKLIAKFKLRICFKRGVKIV